MRRSIGETVGEEGKARRSLPPLRLRVTFFKNGQILSSPPARRCRGPSPAKAVGRASPARLARPPTVRSPRHSSCWPVRRSPPRLSCHGHGEVVKQSLASQQELGEDSAVWYIVPTEEVLDTEVDAVEDFTEVEPDANTLEADSDSLPQQPTAKQSTSFSSQLNQHVGPGPL